MGVVFQIEGCGEEEWEIQLSNANASLLSELMGLDLNPYGFGWVGDIKPDAMVPILATIEGLMMKDLDEFARPTEELKVLRKGATQGNVHHLKVGIHLISFGADAEYIGRRLTQFYSMFCKAIERNVNVKWC